MDNVEKVVSEHLPDAKLGYKEILEFHPDRKEMFQAKNMDHFLVAVYKMNWNLNKGKILLIFCHRIRYWTYYLEN